MSYIVEMFFKSQSLSLILPNEEAQLRTYQCNIKAVSQCPQSAVPASWHQWFVCLTVFIMTSQSLSFNKSPYYKGVREWEGMPSQMQKTETKRT